MLKNTKRRKIYKYNTIRMKPKSILKIVLSISALLLVIIGSNVIMGDLVSGNLSKIKTLPNLNNRPYLTKMQTEVPPIDTFQFNLQKEVKALKGIRPKKDYRMAFVLLVENRSDVTPKRLEHITKLKNLFHDAFRVATLGYINIDTSEEVKILQLQPSMLDPYYPAEEKGLSMREVMKSFYQNHPDAYEFVAIYSTFKTPHLQNNETVQNHIKGIGLENFDVTAEYGAINKNLESILFLQTIDQYTDHWSAMNGLFHEIGHRWCCYVGENFAQGVNGAQLEITQPGVHFYIGVQSPHTTFTPMGSLFWEANGDGTYKIPDTDGTIPVKYHPFDLYFMGVLDQDQYSTKHQIFDAGIAPNFNFSSATPYKQVSVNNIIQVEGTRIE